MRLFFGLELPERVRTGILSLKQTLAAEHGIPQRCFVRPENLHVTIKFFGELSEENLSPLSSRLKGVALPLPLTLAAARILYLPERGPVRIIAVGLDGDLDRLHSLHELLEAACEELGISRERRRFTPHITFARLRAPLAPASRRSIESIRLPVSASAPFRVNEVVLFQSHLEPAGPCYVPLARFPS